MIIKLLDKIFMDKNNQKYKIKFKKKMIILLYKKRKNSAMILIMIKFSLNKNNKKTKYLKFISIIRKNIKSPNRSSLIHRNKNTN